MSTPEETMQALGLAIRERALQAQLDHALERAAEADDLSERREALREALFTRAAQIRLYA